MQLSYTLAVVLAGALSVCAAPSPSPSGTPSVCPYTCPTPLNWVLVDTQKLAGSEVKCDYFSIGLDPTLYTCEYDTKVSKPYCH
jgi:hypothetical protein